MNEQIEKTNNRQLMEKELGELDSDDLEVLESVNTFDEASEKIRRLL